MKKLTVWILAGMMVISLIVTGCGGGGAKVQATSKAGTLGQELIDLENHIPPNLPKIFGNKTKLQQVFVNLISNARDALNAQTDVREKQISIHCERDENTIRIQINDNGIGIDEKIQSRIFDSFFSTKTDKQGTGLGLSIARTIIADHKGQVNFSSTPGEGTSFIVRLPFTEYEVTKILSMKDKIASV